MFYFFQKKKFLVDSLENFIDIHNHILPGIDDGAKTVEDSINIIKGFADFGVTTFIATPHIIHNYYPNTTESIRTAHNLVQDELLHLGLKHIALESSSEYMIDSNFENLLEPFTQEQKLSSFLYFQNYILEKIDKNEPFL